MALAKIFFLLTILQATISLNPLLKNGHHSENYYAVADSYISWRDAGDSIDFTISSAVEDNMNVWTAIGFSHDQEMGNDDACVCVYSNKKVEIGHMFNYKYEFGPSVPGYLVENEKIVGLSSINVIYDPSSKTLTCSFNRRKAMPNIKNYFSLVNGTYYLLTASGKTDFEGNLKSHGPNHRGYSSSPIDFRPGYQRSPLYQVLERITDAYQAYVAWNQNLAKKLIPSFLQINRDQK